MRDATPIVVNIEYAKTTLTEAEARAREEELRRLVQEIVTTLGLIPEGYELVSSDNGPAGE